MDTITFLGPRVPQEIKKFFPFLSKLKQENVLTILRLVSEYLLNRVELTDEVFPSFAEKIGVDLQTLSVVFTGLLTLLRAAIKSRVKTDLIQKDLVQELRFPEYLANDILKLLKTNQAAFEEALVDNRLRYPTLQELRWRVDVTLSTNAMARVLRPTILVQVSTSDGKRKTFDMSVEKFNELRYNVAKTLKEVEDVEKLQILKIGQ
eukprot:TRINITY_DN2492_c0_g1_i1.p1 TRINITY_DN2492_c0_g1~~TRINITY_DN2492_c0_g1_i1.p1  ORF type:complete len:206 (-),score=36.64 TRINITY_DN2492_c0_g1_i1:80-697(-)